MQKKFSFIFFGAGPNQISYIKHSYNQKNYNIVIHNQNDKTVLNYTDKFFLGSVYNKKNVLNICKKIKKNIKVDDIICRSTGPSIISAAAAFSYLKIKRVSTNLAKCIYSKYYFHKFLKSKKIPSIKSFLITKNKKIYPKGIWVLKPDCPIYGKIFIYKINNQKLPNRDFVLVKKNSDNKKPIIKEFIAGVSVGIIEDKPNLDLDYEEDSKAQVDGNFVICESGKIAEIQTTGEEYFFSREQYNMLFDLASEGVSEIIEKQKKCLSV